MASKKKIIFLFWWLSLLLFGTFYNQEGLEYSKFRAAKAIALDYRLDIGNRLDFHSHSSKGVDGKIYVHQPTGVAFYISPLVFVLKVLKADKWSYFLTKGIMVFGLEALALTFLTLFLAEFAKLHLAFSMLTILVFGSDWFSHWKTFGSDGISISFLVLALAALFRPNYFPSKFQGKSKLFTSIAFIASLFVFLSRYQMAIVLAPLIFFLFIFKKRKESIILGCGFFASVLIQTSINYKTMGSPLTFAVQRSCFNSCLDENPADYIEPSSRWFIPPPLSKISYDLVSKQAGILLYSPLLLLIFLAIRKFYKNKYFLLSLLLGSIVLIFAFMANTTAAGGWGNRFAQSLHLFFGIPIGIYLLTTLKERIGYLAVFLLNPFVFAGSFLYSAERYSVTLYKPELMLNFFSDFLRWNHVELSNLSKILFSLLCIVLWSFLFVRTFKKLSNQAA